MELLSDILFLAVMYVATIAIIGGLVAGDEVFSTNIKRKPISNDEILVAWLAVGGVVVINLILIAMGIIKILEWFYR